MQAVAPTSNTATGGGTDVLNAREQKDMFLQLLVAQLQNQDPINPVGNEEFLGQMAQFTSVEQMVTMVEKLEAMASDSTFMKSVTLIGKDVDYIGSDDQIVTGARVTAVSTTGGDSELVMDNGDHVRVDQVVRVQ